MTDFERKVEEELKKQQEAILKPNIAVVGGTGVGKSSLVNRFFGENFAEIGSGKPITKGMVRYEKEDIPVSIEEVDTSKDTEEFTTSLEDEVEDYYDDDEESEDFELDDLSDEDYEEDMEEGD